MFGAFSHRVDVRLGEGLKLQNLAVILPHQSHSPMPCVL